MMIEISNKTNSPVICMFNKCFKIFQNPQGQKQIFAHIQYKYLYSTFELIFCSTPVRCVFIGGGFLGPVLAEALNIYWIFEYWRHSFASKWVLLVWVMDNFSLTPVSLYATRSLLSEASHCFHLIVAYTHFSVSWKYGFQILYFIPQSHYCLAEVDLFSIVKNMYFMGKNFK